MNRTALFSIQCFILCTIALLSACTVTTNEQTRVPFGPASPTPTTPINFNSTHTLTPSNELTEFVTDTPIETVTPTPPITNISTPTPMIEVSPTSTATITNTVVFLQGPLVAYRVQNDDIYLLLFDIGTLTFREIRNKDFLTYPFSINWLDNGCSLYIRGQVIDLLGNVVEIITDLENEEDTFRVFQLSPDRNWGLNEIYMGTYERESIEHRSLEILNRANPNSRISLAPNGGAYAYAWSPGGEWLAFSDYDENHILQVYRASSGGQTVQQLTFHDEDPGIINLITWSSDEQKIAYAASILLPYQFEQGDEGWVGLISLTDLQIHQVIPNQFAYTKGMWWGNDDKQIVIIGESLLTKEEPSSGLQIHWADGRTGIITKSFYQSQAPDNSFAMAIPVGDIDTIFFGSRSGYYLLNTNTNRYEKILDDIETDGLIRDFAPSPFSFSGEDNCLDSIP